MPNIEILSGGNVVNTIVASEEFAQEHHPGAWRLAVEQPAEPVAPAPAVPTFVTRRQGRLALLHIGKLDDAEAAIASIGDPALQRAAQIEYEADTWERDNPCLIEMWLDMGGTLPELDDIFTFARTL